MAQWFSGRIYVMYVAYITNPVMNGCLLKVVCKGIDLDVCESGNYYYYYRLVMKDDGDVKKYLHR